MTPTSPHTTVLLDEAVDALLAGAGKLCQGILLRGELGLAGGQLGFKRICPGRGFAADVVEVCFGNTAGALPQAFHGVTKFGRPVRPPGGG